MEHLNTLHIFIIPQTTHSSAALAAWHRFSGCPSSWQDWRRGGHRWHRGLRGSREG